MEPDVNFNRCAAAGVTTFAYDDIGNRLWSCEFGTNTTYTANNLNQYTEIVRSGVTEHPAFDADGNQTDITTGTGRWLVEYNGENRPVRWTRPADGTMLEMAYDSRGRRVRSSGDTFVYDGYLNVGATVWDPTEPVATRPLVWLKDNDAVYYLHDGNKNVTDVVSGAGTTQYSYAPFGKTAIVNSVQIESPYGFSSEFVDYRLMLFYYNYRYYNPDEGRWIRYDPVLESGFRYKRTDYVYEKKCLEYSYLNNRTVDQVDSLGLHTVADCESWYDSCNEGCRNIPGNQRCRRKMCWIACNAKYATCLASADETIKIVVGTIVIGGVTYLICVTAGGATILLVL